MELLTLVRNETERMPTSTYVAAGISGLANTGILAVINHASQSATDPDDSLFYMVAFLIVFAIYVLMIRYAFDTVAHVFENMIHSIRTRLTDKIRNAQLEDIEQLGRGRIHTCLVGETAIISSAQIPLVAAFQALLLVFCITCYIAILSPSAFLASVVLIFVGTTYYFIKVKEAEEPIREGTEESIRFVDTAMEMVDGFKEVRLNHNRATAILAETTTRSDRLRKLTLETNNFYNHTFIFSQSFFYILMAVIVFILPRIGQTYTEVLSELTASILFLMGPLSLVIGTVPLLTKVNVSAANIMKLEKILDALNENVGKQEPKYNLAPFSKIVLDDLVYSYQSSDGRVPFSVGPINLTVNAGELIFVVGGNGSGKSTFMKLLSGLYLPKDGSHSIDDQPISRFNIQDYRELFSIIFTDFHLFRKLYGLQGPAQEVIDDLLKLMQLHHKTSLEDEQFTNLDLSTGQRKRLAMIVAWLEERPIFIFDEWAADQDPQFRDFYYTDLLQQFKKLGKTVIAVSHDDRYFHLADRVLKMESGHMEELPPSNEH